MADIKVIGEVESVPFEIKHIEWKIPNFFANSEDVTYWSPSFSAADASWWLRLSPRSAVTDFILVGIWTNSTQDREVTLEYCFGLRKCDGIVTEMARGILEKDKKCGWLYFIKKTELQDRKAEFIMSSDTLTVTCTIKWMTGTSNSTEPNEFGKSKSLKLTRLDKLSANLKNLLDDKESCDVILKVKDKEFKAHRLVLMSRCSVFAATFKHDTLERQTGIITIPDCDPYSFEEFLRYLYSGELEELSFQNALNLYYTSDKYDVEELKDFCVEQLKQHLTVETICEIAVLAEKYEELQLFNIVQGFFNEHFLKIFLTSQWKLLLKNDHNLADKLLTGMSNMKLRN